jgi:predicted oxidoreductase
MKAIFLQRTSRKITRLLNISRSHKYNLRKCTVLFGHNILRILRDKERVTGIAGNSTQGDIGEREKNRCRRQVGKTGLQGNSTVKHRKILP